VIASPAINADLKPNYGVMNFKRHSKKEKKSKVSEWVWSYKKAFKVAYKEQKKFKHWWKKNQNML